MGLLEPSINPYLFHRKLRSIRNNCFYGGAYLPPFLRTYTFLAPSIPQDIVGLQKPMKHVGLRQGTFVLA
jgi:hypothetical protein